MAMRFKCACGKALQIREELFGKKVRCPQCQKVLNVPAAPNQNSSEDSAPLADDILPGSSQPAVPTQPVVGQFPAGSPQLPGGQQTAPQSSSEFGLPGQYPMGQPMQSPGSYPVLKQPQPKPKSKTGLIIGLVAGGVAVLVLGSIATVVAIYLASSKKTDPIADIQTPDTPSVSAIDYGGEPLTEEECMAAAQAFCEAIESGELELATSFVDFEEIYRRTVVGIDLPAEFKLGFKEGFIESGKLQNGLAKQFYDLIGIDGSIRAIRSRQNENELRVWIRIDSFDRGIAYQDLVFFRDSNGEVMIGDMYVVTTGSLLTRSMRSGLVSTVVALNPTVAQRITGADRDLIKYQRDIDLVLTSTSSNPRVALDAFERLSPRQRITSSISFYAFALLRN